MERPEISTIQKSNAVKELLDRIGLNCVSEDLIKIHNHVCHSTDEQTQIDKETQISLWNVYETAKLIKAIEAEMFPPENEKIEELLNKLEESEKEKESLKLLMEEKEKLIEIRGQHIETLQKICGFQGINTSHLKIKK